MKKPTSIILLGVMIAALGAMADDKKEPRVVVVSPDRSITVSDDATLRFIDERDGAPRAFLGVNMQELTSDLREYFRVGKEDGVLVSGVVSDSPADKGGLKAGDVIVAIDGQKVHSSRDVGRAIADHKSGDQVRIEVVRNGAPQQLFATLVERERPQIFLRRLPEGEPLVWTDEHSGEALDRLRDLVESSEWKTRVKRMGDCDDLRVRIQELEKKLQKLEKEMSKK